MYTNHSIPSVSHPISSFHFPSTYTHIFSINIIIIKIILNTKFTLKLTLYSCNIPKSKHGVDVCLEVHYCLENITSYLWIKQGIVSISFERFIYEFWNSSLLYSAVLFQGVRKLIVYTEEKPTHWRYSVLTYTQQRWHRTEPYNLWQ